MAELEIIFRGLEVFFHGGIRVLIREEMNKKITLSLVIFITSCSPNTDVIKIADEYCKCCNSILSSDLGETDKKIKLEDCGVLFIKSVERKADSIISEDKKLSYRYKLAKQIDKYFKKNCQYYNMVKTIYDTKRVISPNLSGQSQKCREILKEGKFKAVGIQENIFIHVYSDTNRVDFVDLGYYSTFIINWVDDCSYYLKLIESNRPDATIGDSILTRIINIEGNTIDYELDLEDGTFPQKMEKLDN